MSKMLDKDNSVLEYNTTNGAADCEVLFLDEIFKASSAILNSLLTLLNEKVFQNGFSTVKTPLRLCFAASNEYPADNGLAALFDRFLVRCEVEPVAPHQRQDLIFGGPHAVTISDQITGDEIDTAQAEAAAMTWTDDARQTYLDMLAELNREGITPSDRRMVKAPAIVQAAAWLDGAAEVSKEHLEVLANVLWDDPNQRDKTREIILKASNPDGVRLNELTAESDEILAAVDVTDLQALSIASKKLKDIREGIEQLTSAKAKAVLTHLDDSIKEMRAKALEVHA